ncbi:MAG: MmgE/PrpD family protein, partial [Pseudomonadota bacterium]
MRDTTIGMGLTTDLITLAGTDAADIPATARLRAEFSLFDWLACGIAGREEPVSRKVATLARNEAGNGISSTFVGMSCSPRTAALVNGTVSHALDYDDTHFAHIGHLSVAIYPAALAVAESLDRSATEMVDAFVLGAEVAIRVGLALGSTHYNTGFHQTATAGAFGATLAASRLLGLTDEELRHAIGLCATRASGLKSQFGTMGKPLNAGFAAANGV